MVWQAGTAPRNAPSAVRSRLPVYRSAALSSMEAGGVSRAGLGAKRQPGLKMLEMRRRDTRAIPPSHQHAVLGLAQIRDAHGQPDSNGGQRDGKSEGGDIRQHPTVKIVRFVAVPLVAGQIVRLGLGVFVERPVTRLPSSARRVNQGARPKLEHAMLFFRYVRRNRPLGLHGYQLRDILMSFSTPATRLTENLGMARLRQPIPPKSHGTGRSRF